MSYNSDLQANNEELQAILNTVNALPNANSGGNVGFVAQDTPPEDTSVLWINTGYEGGEEPPEDIVGIKPSWRQNDPAQPDYIDGRTHYCESTDTVLVDEEITVTDKYYEDTQFIYRHNKDFDFSKEGFAYEVSMFGETVTDVIHNPKARTLRATFSNGVRVIFEENSVWSEYPDGLTRPFTTEFKIVERLIVYHTLDEQYIPDTIARVTDVPSDDHINSLINAALGAIENGTY